MEKTYNSIVGFQYPATVKMELTVKLLVKTFAEECRLRGAKVGIVLGNSTPYDVLVESHGFFYRVQVEVAWHTANGFKVNVAKKTSEKSRPSANKKNARKGNDAIDCIVTKIGEHWVFFKEFWKDPLIRNPMSGAIDEWDSINLGPNAVIARRHSRIITESEYTDFLDAVNELKILKQSRGR